MHTLSPFQSTLKATPTDVSVSERGFSLARVGSEEVE